MRISPNHTRLRSIAIACWGFGVWWIVQPKLFSVIQEAWLLSLAMLLPAIVCFALGIAFWLLSTDYRAGVVLDSKGLMLNLGHSAAFIAWEDIAAVGVSRHRNSLLAVGSSAQLGIKLRNPQTYIQSYEDRLPASEGALAQVMRLLSRVLQIQGHEAAAPTLSVLARNRASCGYDVLVPEALLGGKVRGFVEILETYCYDASRRSFLSASLV